MFSLLFIRLFDAIHLVAEQLKLLKNTICIDLDVLVSWYGVAMVASLAVQTAAFILLQIMFHII